MKKIIIILLSIVILTGCSKEKPVSPPVVKPDLTVEQVNDFKNKIAKLAVKKSWVLDQNIGYIGTTLPLKVEDTYYAEILSKSKDSGFDFTKHLGKEAVEGIANIKYNNGDVAGVGHFIFIQDNIVGAYYMVGNYIYSLNEREVFKKDVEWKTVENLDKKASFKEQAFGAAENLIYWGNYTGKENYLFSWSQSKLQVLGKDKDKLLIQREINLDGLYITSMFFKDIDGDKKSELGLLVSTTPKISKDTKSKLLIYEYGAKLKQKYSLSFEKPMLSVEFDGKDVIATSSKSIEIYNIEDNDLKKNYAYNKVGGTLRVDDIDGSGIQRYILCDASGSDIYVFQRNKDGFEEIWRSYNQKAEYDGTIQTADLNRDGAKEIYLGTKDGNTRKVILDKKGFISKKEDIKAGHKYFVGDFNGDGKYEIFDISKIKSKAKSAATIYKY